MKVKVEGMRTLQDTLKKVAPKAAKKSVRKGVSAGTKLLTKKAKARVHRGHGGVPGLLKKSIGSKVKTYRNTGVTVGIIGPRKGFLHVLKGGERVDPVKYAHVEESGRKVIQVKKKKVLTDHTSFFGPQVQAYKGRPFLKPTIVNDGAEAELRVSIETMKSLNAELAK